MKKAKFDITKLTNDQLNATASYNAVLSLCYHFVPQNKVGKRDWQLFNQVKGHYYGLVKEKKLSVKEVNRLMQLKRLPAKVKRDIEAYIEQG